ncbi:hypothetical protein MAR_003680 [Mya arenaria]|uniref:Uncharacterized protein n=1 Tax=Mya arenaria TaxID=6604 RepID=A0ABY7G6R1_MYAAR|nr:hypothetical protein MAR_003680 [Mya arenaria]
MPWLAFNYIFVDIAIEKVNPMLKSLNKQLVVILRDSQPDFQENANKVHFWNLPMITPGAFAGDFGNKDVFRLLTRIGSNFNTLLRFFINIMSNNTWRKMNVIYEPFGQTESPVKFCHIVADGLVNGFHLGEEAINASVNFMPKYYKFTLIEEIVDVLPEKIGLDGADPETRHM